MARTQRDKNLSFAAMVVGGACVVLVAGVLISVLRSPAVPRPRGLITVVEQVAPETTHPPQDNRDDARVPSAAEPAPQMPPARVASGPPPPSANATKGPCADSEVASLNAADVCGDVKVAGLAADVGSTEDGGKIVANAYCSPR